MAKSTLLRLLLVIHVNSENLFNLFKNHVRMSAPK
ncbi:unnamed protein product [Schistosoma mattheei]|uniref:Uncharacterized protein n=1 Tax=Schistosoma mattheei TaxID=31246 RepID=A0A183NG93_9TREM|nr:unnamed protein product [Schistosoma mattheei]